MIKMNKTKPSLHNGLVIVDKGRGAREAQVGILTGNRMPAFGFDVSGSAPNHYRVVDYGKFGVVVATRSAVEVRVLLDGELLIEQELHPYDIPTGTNLDPRVRQAMAESPQPHFLNTDSKGKPFMFAAHDSSLTPAEIVADQIHPGRFGVAPSMGDIDGHDAPVREEMKLDIDPAELGFKPADRKVPDVSAEIKDAIEAGESLASESSDEGARDLEAGNELPDELKALIAQSVSDESRAAEDETPRQAPTQIDLSNMSRSWAPSHGLVAIGIRMLQTVCEGETMPAAPDGFTYVLFQLNPMSLHSLAQSRLMGRLLIPSREQLKKLMEAEGFGGEIPQSPEVGCCMSHKHKHR